MLNIHEEDFNDRCEELLDKLYQTYHSYHYDVGELDSISFLNRREARRRRKEIRFKELKLRRKYGRK